MSTHSRNWLPKTIFWNILHLTEHTFLEIGYFLKKRIQKGVYQVKWDSGYRKYLLFSQWLILTQELGFLDHLATKPGY